MTPEFANSIDIPDEQPPHIVQFYESDELLEGAVVDFLADGLTADAPIVVIATETHRRAFIAQLTTRGFDPGRRIGADRLIMIDAQETLDKFMVGAAPDRQLFTETVSPVIDRARAQGGGRAIRAYGEMVDLLWRGGNRSGAVALEQLWNELRTVRSFSLLCSYVVSSFHQESSGMQEICRTHTHVRPVLDRVHPDHTAENVRALAAEIGHRKDLERELRSSLRELRVHEQQLEARLADLRRAAAERDVRTRRTERLARITSAIADAVTPEQVFEAVVDQTRVALGASSAALWLTGGGQAAARLVRADGYGDEVAQTFASIPLGGVPAATPSSTPSATASSSGSRPATSSSRAIPTCPGA